MPQQVRRAGIVLAAGEGKRLRSRLPKVLHPAAGRPLLAHALDAVRAAGIDTAIVVASSRRAEIEEAMGAAGHGESVTYVVQDPPRGTGDAVSVALAAVPESVEIVVITNGDVPTLRGTSLAGVIAAHESSGAAMTIVTAEAPPNSDFGRVIRGTGGQVERIVEVRDASAEELQVTEVNAGVYVADVHHLRRALSEIDDDNAQGELYLTDTIGVLKRHGETIGSASVPWDDTRGVNDRRQLAEVSRILRRRAADHWMAEGVTIVDPDSTFIDASVSIAPDVTIAPFTFLEGSTTIGSGARIGPQTRVIDSDIGESVEVSFSVVRQAKLGPRSTVGPFASVRPGTVLGEGARLGTFVETKNTSLGRGSKAPHLSYLGDCEIHDGVNVGAGTITTNWDGQAKHQTVIEDDAYIGSDTMLVAPVRIGKRAATGAGAVVRADVPDDALAVGVPARNIAGRGNKMGRSSRTPETPEGSGDGAAST